MRTRETIVSKKGSLYSVFEEFLSILDVNTSWGLPVPSKGHFLFHFDYFQHCKFQIKIE